MRKTLVIVIPGFPKDEEDTTCVPSLQFFVKALNETHTELNIIVLAFQYPYKPAAYRWNGIKVIAIGGKNKGQLRRGITWMRAWNELRKLNKQYRVIGLLSFWLGECAFIADRFSKKYNLKHYCWLLGQDAKAGNKYVNRIKPAGDNLVALSDFIAAEFNKNYSIMPKHLVPSAIDTSLFKPPPPVKDMDIMGAGSLIPLKQYRVFVEIIGSLKKDFPQIKAIICGKGPEMEMLRIRIKELGIENNLTLMGEIPYEEVLALMQRTKIFMHTSNFEGFGAVCLEALYAGAKLISFVKPMNADIINWHIAKDGEKMQQLAAGILNDPDSRYNPVSPYLVGDNTNAMVKLFDQQETAIS